jgi:hypothetical protein
MEKVMKFLSIISTTVVLALSLTTSLAAQDHDHDHSDVELGYDDVNNPTAILIERDERTSDGLLFFEAEMLELDPFVPGDFSSNQPGFATHPGDPDHGEDPLLFRENDELWIRPLDASLYSDFGLGYVNYYNSSTGTFESSGSLAMLDNTGGTEDLLLTGGSMVSGDEWQYIARGDADGDIHDHIVVDFLDETNQGAYGVLFEVAADFDVTDGNMDIQSEKFWIIWNHGMDEGDFDTIALRRFGVTAVPEPGSLMVVSCSLGLLMLRRRR